MLAMAALSEPPPQPFGAQFGSLMGVLGAVPVLQPLGRLLRMF